MCCSWPGVLCCATADKLEQLLPSPHAPRINSSIPPHAVIGLFMSATGMAGSLPVELVQLPHLEILLMADNPQLSGAWPAGLVLPRLQRLDVRVGSNLFQLSPSSRFKSYSIKPSGGGKDICMHTCCHARKRFALAGQLAVTSVTCGCAGHIPLSLPG